MSAIPYAFSQKISTQDYWFLNSVNLSRIATEVRGLSLDQVVDSHQLGNRLKVDLSALTTVSSPEDYRGLERRLTGYILNYTSGESYGIVGRNRNGDVCVATLEYIDLLQHISRTNPKNLRDKLAKLRDELLLGLQYLGIKTNVRRIDPSKVEQLQLAVMRTSIKKFGLGIGGLIPKRYKELYDRAEFEENKGKSETAQIGEELALP